MASVGSDGAQAGLLELSTSTSSSRESDMADKLQKATSLTIRVLQEITDDFSEERKIGQGGYGKVYVAKLENGEDIAVKILYNNTPAIDDVQFQREFENLMRLEHCNIIRLVGYCYETQHQPMQYMGKTIFGERTYRALCFEYMQNGSLQKHLSEECDGLDWHTRYKIIKGICEGLKHLHKGFKEPIYHLDLKPDNILLDKNMVPKLADFGLSKLFGDQQTMTTQSPIGTFGYMPAEFIHGNIVSSKFDIFSLGVVMIKIISGQGAHSRSVDMRREDFLDLVHANWRNRMQKTCHASQPLEAYCEQVNICTDIALNCMEIDRHKRPNIADIIHQLNDTEDVIEKALSWSTSWHSRMNNTDLVKLRAFTGRQAILDAKTSSKFPVLVQVTAPPWRPAEEMPRAGVDIVAVLNCGLSAYLFTNAMKTVIRKLSPNDRLSIVDVNTNACRLMELTYMSDQGQASAVAKIEACLEGNGCDMAAGLREGVEILRGRDGEERDSRVGCIMFLYDKERRYQLHPASATTQCPSDITDAHSQKKKELDEGTITEEISSEFLVHTFGLDTNSDIMFYIAHTTSGTYSFCRHDHEDLKDALELFMTSITRVAATCVKITLRAHQGVAISSIDSGAYINRVCSEKQSGEIDIHDMYAGEQKKFIVYLTVAEGKKKLLTVGGRYRSLNASKQLADMDVFVLRPRSGCSREKLAMHPDVAAELARIRLVKGLWALILPGERLTILDMENLWDMVRSSEDGHAIPEDTLSRLRRYVDEMRKVACLPNLNPTMVPYLMSWLSCHWWQRATTKGLHYESGAFTLLQPDADGQEDHD